MNFFKKILGVSKKESKTKKRISKMDNLYPLLTNTRTNDYQITGEYVRLIHDREDNYADIIALYVYTNPNDSEEKVETIQVLTENKSEDELNDLRIQSEINFDKLDIPFSFWNETGYDLDYEILSCPISPLSTAKIISKKHMLEAHKMLNADELLVSIPISGVIFVCKKELNEDDFTNFMGMHSYIIFDKNNSSDILCEDLLVMKNGEFVGALKLPGISEKLISLSGE